MTTSLEARNVLLDYQPIPRTYGGAAPTPSVDSVHGASGVLWRDRLDRPNDKRRGDLPTPAPSPPFPLSPNHDMRGRQQPISHWNINYRPRQGAPLVLGPYDTTSINWWPYPSWGQTAAAITPLDDPSTDDPSTDSTALSSSTTDSSSSPTPTSSSPSSSASVITISALPPSSSTDPPNGLRNNASAHPFNLLYLLPVFIVVGLALGALLSVLAFRWNTRRRARRVREPSFQFGPRYLPAANSFNGSPRAPPATDMQEVDLGDVGSPSKYTRHGSRASSMGTSWLSATANGHTRSSEGAKTSRDNLAIPPVSPTASSTARSQSRASTRAVSPDPSTMLSPQSADVPYESIRHQSIRKDILQKLKVDEPVPPLIPTRERLAAGEPPSTRRNYSTLLSPGDQPGPSASGSGHREDTAWVPNGGFRIVEEDASPLPLSQQHSPWHTQEDLRSALQHRSSDNWMAWTQAWSPASSYPPTEDGFTAMPSRKSTVDKKSLVASFASPRTAASIARSESSMLPLSPPQILSPPLESKLLFNPPPGKASARPRKEHSLGAGTGPTTRATRKLHAPTPPKLPLPSKSSSSPYRHRLSKPPPPHEDVPERAPSETSNVSSIAVPHRSPAERHAARQTALSKVGEIVAKSYSQRDGNAATSPTMFGAVTEDEDFAWAVGIDQRLAAMEDGGM
ncbi:hypothetical protein FA95DRAFT_682701 [Auriscalpium vulgare]|uniref:Uncharacterized protein n=1 Tax=Auriscalpium vulgare TaxID=40419 RepID=A0ACB8S1S0_9AGAM|nr:hypothetical protein FA95DRAFT_682701 [Auriscalpium vulgare]